MDERPTSAPDPGAPEPESDAPDVVIDFWKRTLKRRTVQASLGFLVTGWAVIRFLTAILGDHPSAEGLIEVAWVVYGFLFLVVLFAAPLVFSGDHPFRTGFLALLVLVSVGGGMWVQANWIDPGPVPGDTIAVEDEEATPSPPVDQGSPAIEEDEAPPDPIDADESPTDAPRPSDEPVAERTALESLVLLYGESDRITLGVQDRNRALLAGYESPIALRFYSVSGDARRLNVEARPGAGATPLDLPVVGSEASLEVEVATTCGTLTYLVEVVRLREGAEVTATLDRERAEREVERAEALDRCRL